MSVKIRLHPFLQHITDGQEIIEVNCSTTGECLEELERRFPDIKKMIRDKRGQLRPYCEILVNSESVYPKELTTPVKEGDVIDLIFIVTGG